MKIAHLLPLLLLLAAQTARADDACNADAAKKVAAENEAVVKFCSGEQYHGCDYSAEKPPQDETNPDAKWKVKASIIHSFDDKGQPRFMPEGAIFANVSEGCKVTKVWGMMGELK